jgi:hypothetical protein
MTKPEAIEIQKSKGNNMEIAQNHPSEARAQLNRSSPTSNRTSILEPKQSKEDLKSTLKEEKKETKTDKTFEIEKIVIYR